MRLIIIYKNNLAYYKKNNLYLQTKTVTINKKFVGKCMIDFVLRTFFPSTLRGLIMTANCLSL